MCTAIAPLRHRMWPSLSGITSADSIALTYDDGPDPACTPYFLELLDRHRVTATFFLLGSFVATNESLVREITASGHEVAVHGWDHRCLAWKRPGGLDDELRRTRDLLEDVTGTSVRFYRPPYGVVTGAGLLAAHRAGLRLVLWSGWGRDWSAGATPARIVRTMTSTLAPGGTALLHDTDRTSSPGSWHATLAASEILLQRWAASHIQVCSLGEHLRRGA